MSDISKYLNNNGDVNRAKLTQDIKNRMISHDELEEILTNPEITASFFGSQINWKRKNRADWNDDYLQNLTFASVSEVFNEDYLRHLEEVAQYVRNKKNTRTPLLICAATVVVLLAVVLIISALAKK